MDADEGVEFFHFFGTPVLEEVETRGGHPRKEVRDAAVTKALPLHKQEATDAQGRRRFHGAFTGGFSAGYFNTVGSKEGWAPSTFRSSRESRAQVNQSVEQYLDDDELEDLRRTNLQTTADYDTFGSTAAEAARRQAEDEARARPSAIPGLLPQEVVAPVPAGAGIQLLQKMGWRQGKGIGGADSSEAEEEAGAEGDLASRRKRRWGRQAGVGPENTPLHLLAPKSDTYGLGYDPFRGAEEFRSLKQQQQTAGNGARPRGGEAKRQRGIAFGTGVFDEGDGDDTLDDYVTNDNVESYDEETAGLGGLSMKRAPQLNKSGLGDRLARKGYSFEITEDGEDEGQGQLEWHPHRKQQPYALPGREAPLLLHSMEHHASRGIIPGFVRASATYKAPYYPPPQLPPGYVPGRRAAATAAASNTPQRASEASAYAGACAAFAHPLPPQVPPPQDPALKQAIDTIAFYSARNGPAFESVAREKQQRASSHRFLLGGEGSAYYNWKLHSLRSIIGPQPHQQQQQRQQQQQQQPQAIGQRAAPLSAEERGALLGETPLAGSSGAGAAALPAFTVPGMPGQGLEGPSKDEPSLRRLLLQVAEADRQRLQQLLKRSFVSAQSQDMLQPDASASVVGLRPGAAPPPSKTAAGPATAQGDMPQAPASASAPTRIVTAADLSRPLPETGPSVTPAATTGSQPRLPVRHSEEWRPVPLLCKRFNVPDPYHGKAAELQMSRFKTDQLMLPETAARVVGAASAVAPGAEQFLLPPSVAAAIQEAEQQQQQQQQQQQLHGLLVQQQQPPQTAQVVEQDAARAADAFLSLLTGMFEPTLPEQPAGEQSSGQPLPPVGDEPGPAGAAADAEAAAAAERPIDLFKAIFEDSEEEEEEEEPEQQQQQQQAAAPPPQPDPVATDQPQQTAGIDPAQFGFAKLRRADLPLGLSATPAPAARVGPQAPLQLQQGPQIDEALKGRVQEALRNLKKHKKEKKQKKDRELGKKDKRRKEKKGSKEKRDKKTNSRRENRPSSEDSSDS